MQKLSSGRRTCLASASAVECTATTEMPSSLQARSTRSAISPRLAMRILSNIYSMMTSGSATPTRLPALDEDLRHGAGARRGNLVHGLHRLDDEQRLSGGDAGADLDERLGAGL